MVKFQAQKSIPVKMVYSQFVLLTTSACGRIISGMAVVHHRRRLMLTKVGWLFGVSTSRAKSRYMFGASCRTVWRLELSYLGVTLKKVSPVWLADGRKLLFT